MSPPLVKPDTKFFCRKKNKIQIGRAVKIAPAAKKAIFIFLTSLTNVLRPTATVKNSLSRRRKLDKI